MTNKDIDKGIEFVRQQVKKLGVIPGNIFMKANAFVESLSKYATWSNKESNLFANILVINNILSCEGMFLRFTQTGYSFINEKQTTLKIDLIAVLPLNNQKPDIAFYLIWDVIGNDKGENPFYVDGKDYYNAIKRFVNGLPPTYSQYMNQLHENGDSKSRCDWGKTLFCKISPDEISSFLNSLSEVINAKISPANDEAEELIEMEDTTFETPINEPMDNNNRQPKIFISHNTDDRDYAKALVQLLTNLGVNEEIDVFCSSLPGCGVKFGKSFIKAIREQYENHDLIMLFIHSPRYYQSHVSLCEMGAAWIMKNEHFSFLTHDCEFKMLDAVITPTEMAFRAGQDNTYPLLNDFKAFIESKFGLTPKSINRWDDIKSDFINAVLKK